MHTLFDTFHRYLQTHFAARWLLANVAGWSLGLYAGSVFVSLLGGVFGVIFGGALAGVLAGAAQWLALQPFHWAWLWRSALGGALAMLPVVMCGFVLVVHWGVGFLILGAVFGAVFGALQSPLLEDRRALLWVAANMGGGALCACFSFAANPLMLPICCTLGPLLFGAITGWALAKMRAEPA